MGTATETGVKRRPDGPLGLNAVFSYLSVTIEHDRSLMTRKIARPLTLHKQLVTFKRW